jgi:pimeloyl-ACP methyl ester carboxylesterase
MRVEGAMPTPPAPPLERALDAERVVLDTAAGPVSVYLDESVKSATLPPLVLVHSVNAAGSAAEVKPLFEHERTRRVVCAVDLPGFGFSDRSDRAYTPRLMTDALHAVVQHGVQQHGAAVDVAAVSLGCEFAARLQTEAPAHVRRLALISPTGFNTTKGRDKAAGTTLQLPWLYQLLSAPFWSDGIYNTLTRPSVIRYFLEKTWGRKQIDEELWRYDVVTTRQPGAKYAPLHFVSAGLFSADIHTVYRAVTCPAWVSMPTRGDFTNYRGRAVVDDKPNWQFHSVEGGALPYFEDPAGFCARLDAFWLGS